MNPESPSTPAFPKWIRALLLLLAVAAPATYLVMLALHAVNVPYWDDYDAILGNLAWLDILPTVGKKLEWIFLMHGNEHLTGLLQSFAWLDDQVTGHVNFSHMIWVGNACLLLFALIAMRHTWRQGTDWPLLLPFLPLLFHQHYFEATYWGTVALQLFPATLLAWLSLHQLLKGSWKGLIWASLLAAATLQAFGSGLILMGVLLGIVALQRRWLHLLALLPFVALMLVMFMVHYPQMPHQGSRVDAILVYPVRTLNFLLTVAGSGLPLPRHLYWVSGAGLLLLLAWATVRRRWRQSPLLFAFLLFMWMVVGSGALSRAGGGIAEAYAPRYAFYGSLMQALTWVLVVQMLPARAGRVVLVAVFPLSLLVAVLHQRADAPLVRREHERRVNSIVYCAAAGDSVLYRPAEIALQKLDRAIQSGYYEPPQFVRMVRIGGIPAPDAVGRVSLHVSDSLVFSVLISGSLSLPADLAKPTQVQVVLREGDEVMAVAAEILPDTHALAAIGTTLVRAAIDKRTLPMRADDLGLWCKLQDGTQHVSWTGKPLLVDKVGVVYRPTADVISRGDSLGLHVKFPLELNLREEVPIAFLFDAEDRMVPFGEFTMGKVLIPEKLVCQPGQEANFVWINDSDRPFPDQNFSLSLTVSPDPAVRIDSSAEWRFEPTRAGQRVCVDLFLETIGQNNLCLSVGANGYVLRYEDKAQAKVLFHQWMKVPSDAVFTLVVEDNRPILYLNGELRFASAEAMPTRLMATPNIGRMSSDGFAGEIAQLRLWDHATRPRPGEMSPSDTAGVINREQLRGHDGTEAVFAKVPQRRALVFTRLDHTWWVKKPSKAGKYHVVLKSLRQGSGATRKLVQTEAFEVQAP